MGDMISYIGRRGGEAGGGHGPEDPMREKRGGRPGQDVGEIKADAKDLRDRMEAGFDALGGKIEARPTTWMLATFLIATAGATVAVIVGILSLTQGS